MMQLQRAYLRAITSCLALGGALAWPGSAPVGATQSECDGSPPPTISGTNGDDLLTGTPGRDVIDVGNGDDVVWGLGGHDVIIGGTGRDVLVGGTGNDVLCGDQGNDLLLGEAGDDALSGGNGDDIVSASFGNDLASGDRGDDVLAGGPGDDAIDGGRGDDGLGGVHGADQLAGDQGDDRLLGDSDDDSALGGPGRDQCLAGWIDSCETALVDGDRTASIIVNEPAEAGYTIEWTVAAERGAVLVELYAGAELVDFQPLDGQPTVSGTFELDFSEVPGGTVAFFAVVTDANGGQTATDPVLVDVPIISAETSAVSVIELDEPVQISELVTMLNDASLVPVEYRTADVDGPPLEPTPELLNQAAAGGLDLYIPPSSSVIYTPQETPLHNQVDELLAYYERQGINPPALIASLQVEGPITDTDLGEIADVGHVVGTGPPLPQAEPVSSDVTADQLAGSLPSASITSTRVNDQGQELSDVTASTTQAATDAEPVNAFWPILGSFAAEPRDHTRTVNDCNSLIAMGPFCLFSKHEITEEKVELRHEFVFTPDVLTAFGDRADAYEHNLKVTSPGRSRTRPFCNPLSEDNFYIRSRGSKFVRHNVPDEAYLYKDDVIASDPCSSDEVSFGIVYPERLDDDVPEGRLRVFQVDQESVRNDDANRSFNLQSQTLSRDNAGCDGVPDALKKYCIGVRGGQTQTRSLARTGGDRLDPDLPTCIWWSWRPEIDDGPEVLRYCGPSGPL